MSSPGQTENVGSSSSSFCRGLPIELICVIAEQMGSPRDMLAMCMASRGFHAITMTQMLKAEVFLEQTIMESSVEYQRHHMDGSMSFVCPDGAAESSTLGMCALQWAIIKDREHLANSVIDAALRHKREGYLNSTPGAVMRRDYGDPEPPLFWAASYARPNVVRRLIQIGCDTGILYRVRVGGELGKIHTCPACLRGRCDQCLDQYNSLLHAAIYGRDDLDSVNCWTFEEEDRRTEIVELLLRANVHPTAGSTYLPKLLAKKKKSALLKRLIEAMDDKDKRRCLRDILHYAVADVGNNNKRVIEMLLTDYPQFVSVNQPNDSFSTPLHSAVSVRLNSPAPFQREIGCGGQLRLNNARTLVAFGAAFVSTREAELLSTLGKLTRYPGTRHEGDMHDLMEEMVVKAKGNQQITTIARRQLFRALDPSRVLPAVKFIRDKRYLPFSPSWAGFIARLIDQHLGPLTEQERTGLSDLQELLGDI